MSYGLSRNGYIPQIFERLSARGVPWFGVITAFVIGCVCFLPFPSWQSLVGLITSASVLMYAGAPLSLGVFRRQLPNADRPYRLPAAGFMSPLAFIVSGLIILWSGWDTDWKLGVAILLGYVILGLTRVFRLNAYNPVMQWRSAQWLPVYLIGLGVIVYLSPYGPLKDPVIPLWWDIAVVAVFSLLIYYWALAVALPGETIEHMVSDVVAPEEDEHRHLPEIEAILSAGSLTESQLALAKKIFRRLAESEAAAHGVAGLATQWPGPVVDGRSSDACSNVLPKPPVIASLAGSVG